MTPKLLFWFLALALLGAVLASALAGWGKIRRGDVRGHRRALRRAMGLIGVFLLCYVAKVIFLGKEDLASWSRADLWVLWIHEAIVALMLVSGASAGVLAWRAERHLGTTTPLDRAAWGFPRAHRLCGRVAILTSVAAFATASLILLGMLRRAF